MDDVYSTCKAKCEAEAQLKDWMSKNARNKALKQQVADCKACLAGSKVRAHEKAMAESPYEKPSVKAFDECMAVEASNVLTSGGGIKAKCQWKSVQLHTVFCGAYMMAYNAERFAPCLKICRN